MMCAWLYRFGGLAQVEVVTVLHTIRLGLGIGLGLGLGLVLGLGLAQVEVGLGLGLAQVEVVAVLRTEEHTESRNEQHQQEIWGAVGIPKHCRPSDGVHACMRACVHAYMHACVHAYMRTCSMRSRRAW